MVATPGGTVMTCSQEDGIFSWQGQSALGSCITKRARTWLEVNRKTRQFSHAASVCADIWLKGSVQHTSKGSVDPPHHLIATEQRTFAGPFRTS